MAEILKEGMLAEVIVLDRNLFEVKPKEILEYESIGYDHGRRDYLLEEVKGVKWRKLN